MVTSIARQSVIIKCNMQKSILTGNYEFYYASGLAVKLLNLTVGEDMRPNELSEILTEKLQGADGDEREAWLFHLLVDYRPGEEYDTQMKELFLMGKNEHSLWSVVPSV